MQTILLPVFFLLTRNFPQVEQDYGGAIHIGDYLMVKYVRDADLAKLLFAMNDGSYNTRSKQNDEQLRLEKIWKSSDSPEVAMGEYSYAGAKALHTAREAGDGAGRLHRFERVNPRWESTYKRISQWRCNSCPYGSDDLPAYRIVQEDAMVCDDSLTVTYLKTPPTCLLEMLNDDVLLELAAHLPSESLMTLSIAYPRLHDLVTSAHLLLQRELRCFFLRSPLKDSVLGIGISLDPNSRTLSSDFDWLSKEAFDRHRIRTSIQKHTFEYFLPLAFSRPHFSRVCGDIWVHLTRIDVAIRDAEKFKVLKQRNGRNSIRQVVAPSQPHQVVGVVYKMMNNIVVSLMKSCEDAFLSTSNNRRSTNATLLHASEKAVVSYCHLFHLLLCLSRTTPAILLEATARLQRFVQFPASRVKTEVPDLGELIVLITLVLALPPVGSTPVTWAILNGPFLEEAIVRNVRWVLKDAPELEILEQGTCDYRLFKTFEKSKTGLRLIMFQITFLDIFLKTYSSNITRLDDNYGFADAGMPVRMVEEFKEIYKVNFWPSFFERVWYARGLQFGKEKFSDMLRAAVRTSGQRGYHTPKSIRQLDMLSRDRERVESEWMKARR